MDSRQFIESGALETYAMGLATEQEAKLVAEMVARYPEVKAELAAIESSLENFDQKNAVAPPAHLKAEILSKISGSSARSASVTSSVVGKKETGGKVVSLNGSSNGAAKQNNFYKYAAAVAMLLFVGTAWYALSLRMDVEVKEQQIASLTNDLDLQKANFNAMDTLISELSDKNLTLLTEVNLLKKPGMKSVELKGMEVAPAAKAMAYANASTGEVYLEIMNLPAAPDGMQYQFWGIVDSKPVNAGMIPLDGDTSGIHPMTTVPNAVAYAISLEPKGGSQQPRGKIYVMGNS